MRVPLSWLSEFVELDADPEIVAEKLTAAGMKVEKIERPGADVKGVFVGEVSHIEDHPNADKLTLVQVRVGNGEHRVVCGAKNFKVGDRVPVALPGALLPGMAIERRKIRGETSDGMLCSARELGLGQDHSGILVLPPETPLGDDVRGVLELDQPIFELEITPNRPDAMSLIGVAREVAACFGGTLRSPLLETRSVGTKQVEELADIDVQDPSGCPRYVAKVVTGISVGPSPEWVQRRLTAAGLRPISNVVDATNYVLMVTGQPLHAFDLDLIQGQRIVVRSARPGEAIVTLDGEKRSLASEDLVIADADGPVAIAGVMGGAATEVTATTGRILIESAYFDPRRVFATGRRLDLRTEASARFERGSDPNAALWAAEMACSLIVEWAGGEAAPGAIDVYPKTIEMKPVTVRTDRARGILGVDIADQEMMDILDRLDLAPSLDDGSITVTPPTRRQDLRIEEDLIEEIARVMGYDKIPLTLPSGRSRAGSIPKSERSVRRARQILAGAGCYEARTSILIGPKAIHPMLYLDEGDPAQSSITLLNPLNREESVLRTSLLPGLLAATSRNFALRNLSVRLFEIGPCFLRASAEGLPEEPLTLGLIVGGIVPQEWYSAERMLDVYDAKGALESLFLGLGLPPAQLKVSSDPVFHPTRCAAVWVNGTEVGVIGELSPDVVRSWDLPYAPAAFEIHLGALLAMIDLPSPPREAGKFPATLQDLAVSLPEQASASDVVQTARLAGGDLLESVRVFDVYRGPQVGEGRKSLALALRFRSHDRTLTDAEASSLKSAIAEKIAQEHGGAVRGEQ